VLELAFAVIFTWFWEKGFNNLYSRFYRVGDGNQRAAAADRPLESPGAPGITLCPQVKN
jgi:hypothetical protein